MPLMGCWAAPVWSWSTTVVPSGPLQRDPAAAGDRRARSRPRPRRRPACRRSPRRSPSRPPSRCRRARRRLAGVGREGLGKKRAAASVSMRGVAIPLRGSTSVRPVVFSRLAIPVGESPGCAWRIRAAAPATAGPRPTSRGRTSRSRPRVTTSQKAPGASRERFDAELEKQTIVSGDTDESSHSVPPESPGPAHVGVGIRIDGAHRDRVGDAGRRRDGVVQRFVAGGDDDHDPGRVRRVDGRDVVGVEVVAVTVVEPVLGRRRRTG